MKKKLLALVIGISLAFGITLGVSAAPVLEKITAYFDWSIKFDLDGKEWTPVGQDGKKLAPVVHNGTTYLPVRAIGEALDVAVDWDAGKRAVILGERNSITPITSEKVDVNYSSSVFATEDKAYTVQNGVDYKSGIVLDNLNSAAKTVDLIPNNNYQTIQLSFFALNKEESYRIHILKEDDTVLKDITLSPGQTFAEVDLDIGGVKELSISAKSSLGGSEKIFVTGSYQ